MSIKLKKLYNAQGHVRPYREDEKGREYLYYEDKENRLVIRAALPTNEDVQKINQVIVHVSEAQIMDAIKRIGEYDRDGIWIIETKTGKFLAAADVMKDTQGDDDNSQVISYYFKNSVLITSYEEKLKKALYNLCEQTWIYPILYHETSAIRELIYNKYS